jgi:hypothetical protein
MAFGGKELPSNAIRRAARHWAVLGAVGIDDISKIGPAVAQGL